jgi:aspartyl-tRNA(Asn)/glutamyl-tRNA(Gln) amidotransferase subunit A
MTRPPNGPADPRPQVPDLTIQEFGRRLRSGETTCERAAFQFLELAATQGKRLNAFILVMADEALHQARDLDRELAAGRDRGPLHGVPITVKDLVDVRGTATTAASRVREGHIAARDCTAVAHLRQAGAVFLGKTNLHEFAFGTTSEDSAFGAVRNPFDLERSAGGSSGGSAAALAAGIGLGTVGTDTGGSIRIPAAACGLVGLKPTLGEVSVDGVVPLSRTLDHVGPLARTVTDACLMYQALIGDDTPEAPAPIPLTGVRLAVPRRYFCELLDEDVRTGFESVLERLRSGGAHIDDVEMHHASDIAAIYLHIALGDAAAYHARTLDSMPERYTPPVRTRLELGRYILAEDYVRALAGRDVLTREVDAALGHRAALVLPTLAIPAPRLGTDFVTIGGRSEPLRNLMLRLTQLFNVTGHPAVSLPAGFTPGGLPHAVQLVGARNQTDALLRVALACENNLRNYKVANG